MTPRRGIVLLLTFILAALLAVGAWGQGQPSGGLSDEDYISIAISQPQVFHPTPGGGQSVSARVVSRTNTGIVVEVVSDGQRFRVVIDPGTNKVTQVSPE